jgi:hypothetical protein
MSKFFQSFLSGVFFTFILDFFLFLGIFQSYIKVHEIDVYYNILFADYQNIYIYIFFSILFGILVTYIENTKLSIVVIGGCMILALSSLIQPIGNKIGSMILMSKNITLHDDKYTYKGDIYYNGREKISFYDYEIKKIITLDKKDLK